MNADLQQLYAHHAVGLCPEERCVAARANLASRLLVSEAELATALRATDPWQEFYIGASKTTAGTFAAAIFAALVAAQEKGT